MKQAYFVTGTDTDVGKTIASLALIRHFVSQGKLTLGMKPVAAGCSWHGEHLRNNDALLLQQQSNVQADYQLINPFAYEEPVSPHIAGRQQPADLRIIQHAFNELQSLADVVIVEGAGGWFSPLAEGIDNGQLAQHLALPVILVVAMRLGCINQARLSMAAILQSGLRCVGWIANGLDPQMLYPQENIDYLQKHLEAPLLGVLPYHINAEITEITLANAALLTRG